MTCPENVYSEAATKQRLPLTYEFDPASERDGVTVTVPLPSLNAFAVIDFDYFVPALLPEKITALMKSSPTTAKRVN